MLALFITTYTASSLTSHSLVENVGHELEIQVGPALEAVCV
jgi:hypothetical protein